MRDACWYIWNFLWGAGTGLVFVVGFMKVSEFLCKKCSDNPKT